MKLKRDHIVGTILVLIGIVGIVMSRNISVTSNSTDPGSRLFPVMACILLIVCGMGVLLSAAKSTEKQFLPTGGWKKLAMSFGVLVLYALALKYIGFLISTPVFLFLVVTLLADGKKIAVWKKLLYSIIITALSWYVFHQLLAMNLPRGMLF